MSLVKLEREQGVAVVTLARPAAGNALVPELFAALAGVLATIRSDAAIGAVLLRAEGAAFSLGGDMRRFAAELGGDVKAYGSALVADLNRAILALLDLPQPVVAAVQGPVSGGSLGFVLASDLVYVTPSASFKAHYATAGFAPDGGWSALLPQVVGARRAAECIYTNRTITAKESVEWGLANALVPADRIEWSALHAAAKIARFPAGSTRSAKRLLAAHRDALADRLEAERHAFVAQVGTDEARRGIAGFLDAFTGYPAGDGFSHVPTDTKAEPCT